MTSAEYYKLTLKAVSDNNIMTVLYRREVSIKLSLKR